MMAEAMAPLGPAGASSRCPGCGSAHTTWVRAAAQDNLLCKTCGTCWHAAAGQTDRVDLLACAGCDLRPICEAARG